MKAYEAGQASYFATPPVNLVYAFHASLTAITKSSPSLEERFKIHKDASAKLRAAAAALGLKQVALDPAYAANGMTAVREAHIGASLLNHLVFFSFTSQKELWHRTSFLVWVRGASSLLAVSIRILKVSAVSHFTPFTMI